MSQANEVLRKANMIGLTFAAIDIGTTIIGGAAVVALSSATLPVLFGLAAIGVGVYQATKAWPSFTGKAPAVSEKEAEKKMIEALESPAKMAKLKKTMATGLSMGLAKFGAGIGLLANLGSVGAFGTLVLGASALAMTAIGGFVAFGGAIALGAMIKMSDKTKEEVIKAVKEEFKSAQPASKLGSAEAKAGFNASAEKPAATNDNAAKPAPVAQPKRPAA